MRESKREGEKSKGNRNILADCHSWFATENCSKVNKIHKDQQWYQIHNTTSICNAKTIFEKSWKNKFVELEIPSNGVQSLLSLSLDHLSFLRLLLLLIHFSHCYLISSWHDTSLAVVVVVIITFYTSSSYERYLWKPANCCVCVQ